MGIKDLFSKVVLPMWVLEFRDSLPAPAHAPAGEAVEQPPQKKRKTHGELNEAIAQRRAALQSLSSAFFLEVNARASGRRGSGQDTEFTWFKTATTKQDREQMQAKWTECGHQDLYPLFHPGSNKPFTIKQCAAHQPWCLQLNAGWLLGMCCRPQSLKLR